MDMDNAWKQVYNRKALRDIPDYDKACWTKDAFEELFAITLDLIEKISKKENIKNILDVGCGPGNYCYALHEKGYELTGIDYSENMVDIAQRRYPNIRFLVGNGYDLQFKDSSFDLTMSIGAMQCLYHHENFLNELARVARKYIIINTYVRDREEHDPKAVLHRRLEVDNWPIRDYNRNEIVPILENAGFDVEIITHHKGVKIETGVFIIARKKDQNI